MQLDQIHVDLETLDTAHTAQILSIGAVWAGEEFYAEVDTSGYEIAFTTSEATKKWWEDQGGFQPSTMPFTPYVATSNFVSWVHSCMNNGATEVWANSPSFDCDILSYHAHYFNLSQPWKFWQERDVRTVKALARSMNLRIRESKNPHNALQDAKNQQQFVDSVYRTIARNCTLARDCLEGVQPEPDNDAPT